MPNGYFGHSYAHILKSACAEICYVTADSFFSDSERGQQPSVTHHEVTIAQNQIKEITCSVQKWCREMKRGKSRESSAAARSKKPRSTIENTGKFITADPQLTKIRLFFKTSSSVKFILILFPS